jgi:hypothetical protein
MTESVKAQSMRQVDQARKHHDRTCRYKGTAAEVHIHPDGLAELTWEEGEIICGLVVVADKKLARKRLRVYCDAELDGQGPPRKTNVSTGTHTLVPAVSR